MAALESAAGGQGWEREEDEDCGDVAGEARGHHLRQANSGEQEDQQHQGEEGRRVEGEEGRRAVAEEDGGRDEEEEGRNGQRSDEEEEEDGIFNFHVETFSSLFIQVEKLFFRMFLNISYSVYMC